MEININIEPEELLDCIKILKGENIIKPEDEDNNTEPEIDDDFSQDN